MPRDGIFYRLSWPIPWQDFELVLLSLCPGTMRELLSLCPEKLHCPILLETLIQNVQNIKIRNKQFIWGRNDSVNPTKYFDFHTASPSTLSCNIHMARTDDSGLFREPTTYYFFCLKSVYTASAFLVADFSKLHHILVSHVSQTNKVFFLL